MMISTQLFAVLIVFVMHLSNAQFGLPKQKVGEVQVDADGTVGENMAGVSLALVNLLSKAEKEAGGALKLSQKDVLAIDGLIKHAVEDPETKILIQKMKVMQRDVIEETIGETTPLKIINNLKAVLEELMALEILFEDKDRAFRAMEKDGMIDKKRIPEYRKNPGLLEEDTRRSLYFSFISMAVVGQLM
mmetsp:Transcript_21970/g.25036  ORF Transcript_21970/g.25036 Transcript_21970/m.25036 type:complete len:189 (+) Transcript_21970:59-625(+)